MKMGMLAAISLAFAGMANKGKRMFIPGEPVSGGRTRKRRMMHSENSKYTPHQSIREKTRRLRQAAEGKCHNMPIWMA